MFRREAIQAGGFHHVLGHACSVLIHRAQVALASGIALIGGFTQPADRRRRIRGDAKAVKVHQTELRLRIGVIGCGQPAVDGHRCRIILLAMAMRWLSSNDCGNA
ncbi:hypothetical protein LP420_20915 [Massilia sp. B-10]|nr:hypothetical protein LP420_20915 [Massilia sp. B-10]